MSNMEPTPIDGMNLADVAYIVRGHANTLIVAIDQANIDPDAMQAHVARMTKYVDMLAAGIRQMKAAAETKAE